MGKAEAPPPDPQPGGRPPSVCVFCGSSRGANPAHARAARTVGEGLAARGLTLVYGGSRLGVMGEVASGALAAGGQVVGVMPRALLAREIAHEGLTELLVVDSMHARKALMAELSDAIVMLPGGLGTLDEMFEAWTWSVLGIHERPMAMLNVAGYFDPLMAMLDRMAQEGFVGARDAGRVVMHAEEPALLDWLASTIAPRG